MMRLQFGGIPFSQRKLKLLTQDTQQMTNPAVFHHVDAH